MNYNRPTGSRFKTFGEALAYFMSSDRYKVDRHKVATVCGCSPHAIAEWEKDRAVPDAKQRKKLFGYIVPLRSYANLLTGHVDASNQSSEKEVNPEQTFGQALRAARLHIEMSTDEVGQMVGDGVTGQAVSAWELDKNLPVRTHYESLCDCFPGLRLLPEPSGLQEIPPPNGGDGPRGPVVHTAPLLGAHLTVIRPERFMLREASMAATAVAIDAVSQAGIDYAQALATVARRQQEISRLAGELAAAQDALHVDEGAAASALSALQRAVRTNSQEVP